MSLSGASEAALDFVGNEQDTLLVEHLFDRLEEAFRRNDDASFSHHRLGDERRHIAGGRETEEVAQGLNATVHHGVRIGAEDRAVRIRCRQK